MLRLRYNFGPNRVLVNVSEFLLQEIIGSNFFGFVAILPEFEVGDFRIYGPGKSKTMQQPMAATFIFVLQNGFYNGAAGVFLKITENVGEVVVFLGSGN